MISQALKNTPCQEGKKYMTRKHIEKLQWTTPTRRNSILRLINSPIEEKYSFLLLAETQLLKYGFPYPESYFYSYEKFDRILYIADKILGFTHGIEVIRLSEHDKNYSVYNEVIAHYLNTGETYTPTLIYRLDIKKRWDILSVGDLVETLEKKGYKIS